MHFTRTISSVKTKSNQFRSRQHTKLLIPMAVAYSNIRRIRHSTKRIIMFGPLDHWPKNCSLTLRLMLPVWGRFFHWFFCPILRNRIWKPMKDRFCVYSWTSWKCSSGEFSNRQLRNLVWLTSQKSRLASPVWERVRLMIFRPQNRRKVSLTANRVIELATEVGH